MNATIERNVQTRKPAELRTELLTVGRKTVTAIYRRRWAIQVLGIVREVPVRVFRNGMSKCSEHGTAVRCSHVIQLQKTCTEYGLWS
jgi:hypothetical protein